MTTNKPEALEVARRAMRQLSNAERDRILEQYLSDGIAADKARIAELEAALIGVGEPAAYLREDQLNHVRRNGPMLGEIAGSPRADRMPVYAAPQPAPDVTILVETLESIAEYWNQDINEGAMRDACEYARSAALAAIAAYRKQGENHE